MHNLCCVNISQHTLLEVFGCPVYQYTSIASIEDFFTLFLLHQVTSVHETSRRYDTG